MWLPAVRCNETNPLTTTLPAWMGNGDVLLRVLGLHVHELDEVSGPQLKDMAFAAVNIATPHEVSTRRHNCKH